LYEYVVVVLAFFCFRFNCTNISIFIAILQGVALWYAVEVKILGIETSCDETAAAVIKDGDTLLSNVVASSMDIHAQYGGVVPEIAARSHIEAINPVIEQALTEANCTWDDIDAIAVTYGAGLGGSLLVGVLAARTLAIIHGKPLYAANHVMGHVFANFLTSTPLSGYTMPTKQPEFPVIALIVSGGHSQLALFRDYFDYELLGRTTDDAVGEAFDKVAKILGLPYPGGPNISKAALDGDAKKYDFPKAKQSNPYDFSFSGLKTAVLRAVQREIGVDHTFPSFELAERLSNAQKADFAASFQQVAVETLVDKALLACHEFSPKSFVLAGGVAANQELRKQLTNELPLPVQFPDIQLCTDNAAMIATLGYFMAHTKQKPADPYLLDIKPNLSM
jgi:N6-L-threonylcarbamoyladenine synthase